MTAYTVIYDACVLYPAPLRDLLVRLAEKGVVRARWTEQILDEVFASLRRDRPDLAPEKLARTRQRMNDSVRDCLVVGFEPLIDGLALPDPNDRHVLAAAIRSGAQAIITSDLRDFPAAALNAWDIEARHPDDFVVSQVGIASGAVVGAVMQQAAALKNPPCTPEDVLRALERNGLVQTVAELRILLPR